MSLSLTFFQFPILPCVALYALKRYQVPLHPFSYCYKTVNIPVEVQYIITVEQHIALSCRSTCFCLLSLILIVCFSAHTRALTCTPPPTHTRTFYILNGSLLYNASYSHMSHKYFDDLKRGRMRDLH